MVPDELYGLLSEQVCGVAASEVCGGRGLLPKVQVRDLLLAKRPVMGKVILLPVQVAWRLKQTDYFHQFTRRV